MALFPTGKGMYIYQLGKIHGGNLGQMVAEAAELQLNWVSLKVADAAGSFQAHLVAPAVQAFKAAGFSVWGWQFIYGNDAADNDNSAAEGAFGAQMVNQLNLDGLMIDAEGRYERLPNARHQAQNYMNALRAGLAGRPPALGLNSFRFPSLHTTFPFAEFAAGCSFHIPQVYWEKDTRPTAPVLQLQQSLGELQAIRQLPFIPLGISCTDNGWTPTTDQITNFNQACLDAHLPGMGWYEWGATLVLPDQFDALGQANGWGGAPHGNGADGGTTGDGAGPVQKHTLSDKTNQQVINLFRDAFGLHQYFDIITSCGLAGLAKDDATRHQLYTGPALEDLQFPDGDGANKIAVLISVADSHG